MMKKILIVGIIASSMVFAKNNNNNTTTGQGMGEAQNKNYSKVGNLTEVQQKDLKELKVTQQKVMAPLMLEKQEKELAIKKEMLADNPNWTNIESLIKEKESIQSKIELQLLKNKVEIKEKFGIDFGSNMDKSEGKGKEKSKGLKK